MSVTPERIIAGQKAYFDTLLSAQTTALNSFEQLFDLNIKAARASLEEMTERSQKAFNIQDPQQAATLASELAQPNTDHVNAYSKELYNIFNQLQGSLLSIAENHASEQQRIAQDTLEFLAKNAPQGSESALAMMKNTLSGATTAYDSLTKAARQAAEITESNVNNTTKKTKRK